MADRPASPLVTFYVMAFNQERFIREAAEGALRQTYSPLEIVLSDDCSTDNTFTTMQEAVRDYSGPHRIILNRNERNLGISDHLNRIIEMSTGELIVSSDGDDVSSPERTARCVDVWLEQGKPAALVTAVSCIDAAGKGTRHGEWFTRFLPVEHETRDQSLLRFCQTGVPALSTCSAAWTRELCEAFGPLPRDIWIEDSIISLRAWLFDRIVFIPEALVAYREHEANICNRHRKPLATLQARREAEHARKVEERLRRESIMTYGPDLDLAARRRWISPQMYEELTPLLESQCRVHRVIEDWWSVGWGMRFVRFLVLIASGRLLEGRWCGPRLLPFHVFIFTAAIWSRSRTTARKWVDDLRSSPGATLLAICQITSTVVPAVLLRV